MPSRGYWLRRGWISRAVRRSASLSLLIATFCISAAAQQIRVSGSVRDSTGAVVPGAAVTLRSQHSMQIVKTGFAGGFVFAAVTDPSGTVQVVANGFAPA